MNNELFDIKEIINQRDDIRDYSIKLLKLSTEATIQLYDNDIKTIGDIANVITHVDQSSIDDVLYGYEDPSTGTKLNQKKAFLLYYVRISDKTINEVRERLINLNNEFAKEKFIDNSGSGEKLYDIRDFIESRNDIWDYPIKSLGINLRAENQLLNNKIIYIGDLVGLILSNNPINEYNAISPSINPENNLSNSPHVAYLPIEINLSEKTITQIHRGLNSIKNGVSLDDLLANLSSTELEIVELRFGLRSRIHTLEEVGKIMGKTRERIRQIEHRAVEKMQNLAINLIDDKYDYIIKKARNYAAIESLQSNIFKRYYAEGYARILAKIDTNNITIVSNPKIRVQVLHSPNNDCVQSKIKELEELLLSQKDYVVLNDVCKHLGVDKSFILNYVDLVYQGDAIAIKNNINIFPDRKTQVIKALERIGRPANITEIAREANTSTNYIKGAIDQYPEPFANVGLSKYGLKAWGYKGLHTGDLIHEFIKVNKSPVNIREIKRYVNMHKDIREGSIYAAIHNDERIIRTIDNDYALRDWGIKEIDNKRNYTVSISEAITEVLMGAESSLTSKEIRNLIIERYGKRAPSGYSTILKHLNIMINNGIVVVSGTTVDRKYFLRSD